MKRSKRDFSIVENKSKCKYLYIIKPVNTEDIFKLYNLFNKNGVSVEICDENDSSFLKVETDNETLDEVKDVEVLEIKRFDLVDSWSLFDKCDSTEYEKTRIFSKLAQMEVSDTRKYIVLVSIGIGIALLFVAGGYFLNKLIYLGIIIAILITIGLIAFYRKKETGFAESRKISQEEWELYPCDIACIWTNIHRIQNINCIENLYLISQNGKCLRKEFSGEKYNSQDKIIFCLKKDAIGCEINNDIFFDNNGHQICYFNGAYITYKENYAATSDIIELSAKYKLQEEAERKRLEELKIEEEKAKQEKERIAKEKEEKRAEKERLRKEEQEKKRLERERIEKEKAELKLKQQQEKERIAKEKEEKRKQEELRRKEEAEKIAKEKEAKKLEKERLYQEEQEKKRLEKERIEKEKAEQKAKIEADKKAQKEKLQREKEEAQRIKTEKRAEQQLAKEKLEQLKQENDSSQNEIKEKSFVLGLKDKIQIFTNKINENNKTKVADLSQENNDVEEVDIEKLNKVERTEIIEEEYQRKIKERQAKKEQRLKEKADRKAKKIAEREALKQKKILEKATQKETEIKQQNENKKHFIYKDVSCSNEKVEQSFTWWEMFNKKKKKIVDIRKKRKS